MLKYLTIYRHYNRTDLASGECRQNGEPLSSSLGKRVTGKNVTFDQSRHSNLHKKLGALIEHLEGLTHLQTIIYI